MRSEAAHGWTLRAQLVLLGALAAWLLALGALRFGFMEIELRDDPCLRDATLTPCRLRAALGLAIHFQWFATTAIVLALGAHLRIGRVRAPLAIAALFAALLALVLYNVRLGAPAAVIALLAMADTGVLRDAR